jgi:hypothetical protein
VNAFFCYPAFVRNSVHNLFFASRTTATIVACEQGSGLQIPYSTLNQNGIIISKILIQVDSASSEKLPNELSN